LPEIKQASKKRNYISKKPTQGENQKALPRDAADFDLETETDYILEEAPVTSKTLQGNVRAL
jgi:hypothetical protein